MNENLLASINMAAIFLPSLIFILTFRGFFRALMAKLMGDDTAYHEGFVSLNPIAHVDLVGLFSIIFILFIVGSLLPGGISYILLLMFLIFIGARWSYEVPINEANFKNKRALLFISLAGFLGNCILSLLFLYVAKYFPFQILPKESLKPITSILSSTIDLSIFIGVFNLLPIPPFDGAILLSYFLPRSSYNVMSSLEQYGLFILMALLLFGNYFFATLGVMTTYIKLLLMALVI